MDLEGPPEGGVVRLRSSMTLVATWYVWHRNLGFTANFVRIPGELTLVSRNEDGYEAIKLVMGDYELGENEHYLDDMEDAAEENEPEESTYIDSDAETESEEDTATSVRNEMRMELEALTEQLQNYNDLWDNERTASGIMTVNMMINQTEERIRYLNNHLD